MIKLTLLFDWLFLNPTLTSTPISHCHFQNSCKIVWFFLFYGQVCWWCQLCSLRRSLSKARSRNLVFKNLPICSKVENPLLKKTLIKFYLATQFFVNVPVKWRDIIHFKIILKNISGEKGFILASIFLFLVSLIILERTKAPWKVLMLCLQVNASQSKMEFEPKFNFFCDN